MKQALIILVILAAVGGAGYLIYRNRKADAAKTPASTSTADKPESTAVKQPKR